VDQLVVESAKIQVELKGYPKRKEEKKGGKDSGKPHWGFLRKRANKGGFTYYLGRGKGVGGPSRVRKS